MRNENVFSIGPKRLSILAGIDGATIVDEKGDIISYGAILKDIPILLFRLSQTYGEELNQEILPKNLIRDFTKKGIAIGENAVIEVLEEDNKWSLVYGQQQYLIERKTNFLHVFEVFSGTSEEGARTTAAKKLSRNNSIRFVVKVSEDGPVSFYHHGNKIFEV